MDSIAGLPERKSEVANLTWNEFGMQSLVLGNGEGLSYKRDRRDLSKGQEDRQPGMLLSGCQGRRQLSALWGDR